jgi:cytochrome P450
MERQQVAVGSCPHFDHHDDAVRGDAYYELYERLRSEGVSWSDRWGGFWLLSRYEDVRAALKDHGTFSSAQGCFLPMSDFRSLGLESDPPGHGQYRKLWLGLVGRRAVEAAQEPLRRLTRRVVSEFAAEGGGDAVTQVSEKLPVEAIALLAGLSDETAARLRDLTVEIWQDLRRDPSVVAPLIGLLLDEVESRRGTGSDDYLASMADAQVDGRPLTRDEIGNILLSAVVAGHETTMNASSNLILELAKDPELQQRLREDPSLVPAVVDECLRHRAPVHLFFRTATRNVSIGSNTIRAGDKVALVYASANRDPDRFEDPATFDPDRGDRQHLTFGWGIHRCVGSPLAETELRMLAEELVAHGTFRLDGEPEPAPLEGGHHMGWRRLPIAYAGS